MLQKSYGETFFKNQMTKHFSKLCMKGIKGVFRTLSYIYDVVFFAKVVNIF